MQRVASRWVPHALTDKQKQPRVDVAKCLYKRYEKEGDNFINRIIATIKRRWPTKLELSILVA